MKICNSPTCFYGQCFAFFLFLSLFLSFCSYLCIQFIRLAYFEILRITESHLRGLVKSMTLETSGTLGLWLPNMGPDSCQAVAGHVIGAAGDNLSSKCQPTSR